MEGGGESGGSGETMRDQSEIIDLPGGHGLFDVRGDGRESALLVGGRAVAMNWGDEQGSVAQYLARAGQTQNRPELDNLRHTLAGHWRRDRSIRDQIGIVLDLFAPGRYRLTRVDAQQCDLIAFSSAWDPGTQYDAFYPIHSVLILTQPTDALDPERVAHFRQSLRDGLRPIAITATVEHGWCEFVLDGHHKLRAYQLEGRSPSFASICRLDAPRLDEHSFDSLIGPQHPLADHYRSVKADHERC